MFSMFDGYQIVWKYGIFTNESQHGIYYLITLQGFLYFLKTTLNWIIAIFHTWLCYYKMFKLKIMK
jgi:hypothetical protein